MNGGGDLQQTLSRLTGVLPRDVSGEAEQNMLAAFRARRASKRRMRVYALVAAACLVLALTWFVSVPHRAHPAADTYQAFSGFVPLPYAESDVPLEEAVIVRVQLPRSELGRLGLPLAVTTGANSNISADLLIGQDGITRAVRIVKIAN